MTYESIELSGTIIAVLIDFKREMTDDEIERLEEIVDELSNEFEDADVRVGVAGDPEDLH